MQFPFTNPRPKSPQPTNPQNPFIALHNHFTSLLTTIPALVNHASQALMAAASTLTPPPISIKNPAWACVSQLGGPPQTAHRFDLAMSIDSIAERLTGIPVYALANSDEEFVLVSGARTQKSLGLLCFKQEDAVALLDQVKALDRDMREGSRVVELALSKVFHLKVDGVAFRFIPDSSQVANAIKEKEKAGVLVDEFSGVPVFQSKSLVLQSQNKRYRPVFFRKEDLEESLLRASREQRKLNPSLRKGDIKVGVLEEIIEAMKGSSASEWDDVVFIPPGFDVPAGVRVEERPTANG